MTESIKQLTKKNMHEVSKAINVLDPTEGIDKKICKAGAYNFSGSAALDKEEEGRCGVAHTASQPNNSRAGGLGLLFMPGSGSSNAGTEGGNYHKDQEAKMGAITSGKIAKDVSSNLDREQKGLVSSAFAKAHEGAEIVIAVDIHL